MFQHRQYCYWRQGVTKKGEDLQIFFYSRGDPSSNEIFFAGKALGDKLQYLDILYILHRISKYGRKF
jgi:hypothetical protein